MNKTCAKLHAILPRKGNKAVVFRRGPSSCVAVIGWDLWLLTTCLVWLNWFGICSFFTVGVKLLFDRSNKE